MTIPHPVAGGTAGQGEPKLIIIPVDNHRMHRPDEDLVVDNRYLDHVEAIQAAWLAKGWTVVRLHYCPMTEELGAPCISCDAAGELLAAERENVRRWVA